MRWRTSLQSLQRSPSPPRLAEALRTVNTYLPTVFITVNLSVPAACFLMIQIEWDWILSMCCDRKGSEKKLCLLGQYLLRPAGKTASVPEMSSACAVEQCQASKDWRCKQIQGRLLFFWPGRWRENAASVVSSESLLRSLKHNVWAVILWTFSFKHSHSQECQC